MMLSEGFIKNRTLLEETSKAEDWFDFKIIEDRLRHKLDLISHSSVLGYVGRFGLGKSTLLHQIESKAKKERVGKEKWIHFEAWQHPNRDNLWEGFVLDFAKQIDGKLFSKTLQKIEGTSHAGINQFIKTFFGVVGLVLSSTVNPILSGLSFGKKFTYFFKSSPAKRVFEIQHILEEIIKKEARSILIVIEDIDRSGDKGIYFLETLNQFFKTTNFDKKVVAIVPISKKNYSDNQDSYQKSLDYIEFFRPNTPDLGKFIRNIFKEEFLDKNVDIMNMEDKGKQEIQVKKFLERIFSRFSEMTPRLLKLIIRNSEHYYLAMKKDGFEPDWRITIMFEAMKHLKFEVNKDGRQTKDSEYCFERIKSAGRFNKTSAYQGIEIFCDFLNIICSSEPTFQAIMDSKLTEKETSLVDDKQFIFPRVVQNLNERHARCNMANFYLNY